MSTKLDRQFLAWSSGISSEIEFWDRWMQEKGGPWPEDYKSRVEGSYEFPGRLAALVPHVPPAQLAALDVGSGPLPYIGRTLNGQAINLTCVDPLAPFYKELGTKHGLNITVEQAFVEDLTAAFDIESFDLVHMQNALDHSFDPV